MTEDGREFEGVAAEAQLDALAQRATDSRPSLCTPFGGLNAYLYRGGFHPGELVVLGGRKGTRKSTVMLNFAVTLLGQDVPVGILTLDESLAMYVAKLMSVMFKVPSDVIENSWDTPRIKKMREEYLQRAAALTLSQGVRPNFTQLQQWLEMADIEGERPRVVFCDYTSLLVHYRTRESERIPRLFEELQVWTKDNDLVTVALHQAGRTDEGVSKKYHGDTPMTAEGLLYGGEQQPDIILATYRPAMNQLGNMSRDIAAMVMGDSFDEEKWEDARSRVRRYKNSTMLQLLKNRPSTKGESFEGVELYSPNESQFLEQKGDGVKDDATRREVA